MENLVLVEQVEPLFFPLYIARSRYLRRMHVESHSQRLWAVIWEGRKD
jgi:hypothetical protein